MKIMLVQGARNAFTPMIDTAPGEAMLVEKRGRCVDRIIAAEKYNRPMVRSDAPAKTIARVTMGTTK